MSLRPPMRTARSCLLLMALLGTAAGCGSPSVLEDPEGPAPEGSRLPHLAADASGRPVLSWVEDTGTGHRLAYAVQDGSGWQAPVTVAEGVGWFVNWADVPSVQPLDDDVWAAHWLVKQPGGMYAYDVALSLSGDGGSTWRLPFTPYHDDTPTEHGFVSLWPVRLADGETGLGAAWLDGRHTLLDPSKSGSDDTRMTLRSAVFDADGREVSAAEIDDRVCDCCPTDVALTAAGPLITYRNRTADEIRDIHAARATVAGWERLGPVAEDGWVIAGCPVNGPAIAAAAQDVVVAWYTEAAGERRVLVSRGIAAEGAWAPAGEVARGDVLGRVDVALLDDGDAVVSWLGRVDGSEAQILLARVDASARAGAPVSVAAVKASRPAGFPRILRHGDGVLVAWTRWRGEVPRVITSRLPVSALPSP